MDWEPRVGMPVLCLKDAPAEIRVPGANYPKKDSAYTIRAVRDDYREDGHLTLLLDKVDNSHMVGVTHKGARAYLEPGFPQSGFAPTPEKEPA